MLSKTKEEAIQQAKANAKHFGRAYWVFRDTSGNYRTERYLPVEQSGDPHYVALDNGMVEFYQHGKCESIIEQVS